MKRSPITKRKTTKLSKFDREFEAMKPLVRERSGGYCEALYVAIRFLGESDPEGALDALNHQDRCDGRAAHVHHRKYRSRRGSNSPDNLADVSNACHLWIHANPELSNKLGLSLHADESESL